MAKDVKFNIRLNIYAHICRYDVGCLHWRNKKRIPLRVSFMVTPVGFKPTTFRTGI